MARLTGEQRYRQACKLAGLRAARRLREFMEGKTPILECGDPKPEIIRELDRAYDIGFADGRASAENWARIQREDAVAFRCARLPKEGE